LTLIELLVVLVILGLFSTIGFQAFFPKIDQAKHQTTRTQMDIIALALDSYRLDVGDYPAALTDLVQSSSPRWKGPYLQNRRIPKDPWGNEYVYQVKDGGGAFDLASTGDGKQEIRYDEGD
jgi:general secretion pathway protein G